MNSETALQTRRAPLPAWECRTGAVRIELAGVAFPSAGLSVRRRRDARVRIAHATDRELGVLKEKLNEQGRRRSAHREVRASRPPRSTRPETASRCAARCRRSSRLHKVFIMPTMTPGSEFIGRRTQHRSSEAPARETDASTSRWINVRSHSQHQASPYSSAITAARLVPAPCNLGDEVLVRVSGEP